jgi:hypothetical protein
MVIGISSLMMLGIMGCHLSESGSNSPTATGRVAEDLASYAQMRDGSVVVTVNGETRQINFATSDWECFLYNSWIYAEINEQVGAGQSPGVNQAVVTLQDVTFTFSNLPAAVTALIVAVKDRPDDESATPEEEPTDTYTELGRYPVSLGTVTIPVSYGDLVRYFGATHYAIWFQALGDENGAGIQGRGYLDMRGMLPDGQSVAIGREVCFGANPSAPLAFLTTSVNVTSPGGDVEDLVEFDVDEPDASRAVLYIESGSLGPLSQDGTTAVINRTTWPPLTISVAPGTPQTGPYTVSVRNDWNLAGLGACPFDPVAVSLIVTTHRTTQTFACQLPCDQVLQVEVAFPAGTITLDPLAVANGWCS